MNNNKVFTSAKSIINAIETILKENNLDDCCIHIDRTGYEEEYEDKPIESICFIEKQNKALPYYFPVPNITPLIWVNMPLYWLNESEVKIKDYSFLLENTFNVTF